MTDTQKLAKSVMHIDSMLSRMFDADSPMRVSWELVKAELSKKPDKVSPQMNEPQAFGHPDTE